MAKVRASGRGQNECARQRIPLNKRECGGEMQERTARAREGKLLLASLEDDLDVVLANEHLLRHALEDLDRLLDPLLKVVERNLVVLHGDRLDSSDSLGKPLRRVRHALDLVRKWIHIRDEALRVREGDWWLDNYERTRADKEAYGLEEGLLGSGGGSVGDGFGEEAGQDAQVRNEDGDRDCVQGRHLGCFRGGGGKD